ncbi:unnamed protein product, partial [Dovyalis caffra]
NGHKSSPNSYIGLIPFDWLATTINSNPSPAMTLKFGPSIRFGPIPFECSAATINSSP